MKYALVSLVLIFLVVFGVVLLIAPLFTQLKALP